MGMRCGNEAGYRRVMTVFSKSRWPLTLCPLYIPHLHAETLPKVLHLPSVSPGGSPCQVQ